MANGREKQNASIEKIETTENDEFPEPRRHNSEAEASRSSLQHASSETSASKVYTSFLHFLYLIYDFSNMQFQ